MDLHFSNGLLLAICQQVGQFKENRKDKNTEFWTFFQFFLSSCLACTTDSSFENLRPPQGEAGEGRRLNTQTQQLLASTINLYCAQQTKA